VSKVKKIIQELLGNLNLIWVVARYNNKAAFHGHYFGMIWEIFNPLIEILLNWFVFGAIRDRRPLYFGGNQVPFLAWMLVGMAAWRLMNRATLTASQSVQKKIKLVSKMQFPVSTLPAIEIAGKMTAFFVTLVITVAILLYNNITPTIYWLQFFYYLFAMLVFMYFFGLLNSTLTMIFRDYHQVLSPIMRLLFWFSGVVWRLDEMDVIPRWFVRAMDLNPFSYIITGFRNSFLSGEFFWQHWETTTFFWLFVLLLAILASHLHMKFRAKFADLS